MIYTELTGGFQGLIGDSANIKQGDNFLSQIIPIIMASRKLAAQPHAVCYATCMLEGYRQRAGLTCLSASTLKSSSTSHRDKGAIEWKAVGRRIRQLRGFEMTQEDFVRRIGVSQGHFSYIERGEKEKGADILLRISEEFEKSIEWLLTGKE